MTRSLMLYVCLAMTFSAGVAACAPATPDKPGWSVYRNPPLGYSLSYPKDWKVDPSFVAPDSTPDREIKGVAFEIPASLAQGTNLSTDLTGVSVESLSRDASCAATRFLPAGENLRTLMQDGKTWSVADSGEGAAGNFYETAVFALAAKTQCLGVRYLIHSTNIGNYDPGTVKAFNRQKLLATFERIRRSLKLEPGN